MNEPQISGGFAGLGAGDALELHDVTLFRSGPYDLFMLINANNIHAYWSRKDPRYSRAMAVKGHPKPKSVNNDGKRGGEGSVRGEEGRGDTEGAQRRREEEGSSCAVVETEEMRQHEEAMNVVASDTAGMWSRKGSVGPGVDGETGKRSKDQKDIRTLMNAMESKCRQRRARYQQARQEQPQHKRLDVNHGHGLKEKRKQPEARDEAKPGPYADDLEFSAVDMSAPLAAITSSAAIFAELEMEDDNDDHDNGSDDGDDEGEEDDDDDEDHELCM